jgi:hypothetical protein
MPVPPPRRRRLRRPRPPSRRPRGSSGPRGAAPRHQRPRSAARPGLWPTRARGARPHPPRPLSSLPVRESVARRPLSPPGDIPRQDGGQADRSTVGPCPGLRGPRNLSG